MSRGRLGMLRLRHEDCFAILMAALSTTGATMADSDESLADDVFTVSPI